MYIIKFNKRLGAVGIWSIPIKVYNCKTVVLKRKKSFLIWDSGVRTFVTDLKECVGSIPNREESLYSLLKRKRNDVIRDNIEYFFRKNELSNLINLQDTYMKWNRKSRAKLWNVFIPMVTFLWSDRYRES